MMGLIGHFYDTSSLSVLHIHIPFPLHDTAMAKFVFILVYRIIVWLMVDSVGKVQYQAVMASHCCVTCGGVVCDA